MNLHSKRIQRRVRVMQLQEQFTFTNHVQLDRMLQEQKSTLKAK